jgi:hypothetical protein
MLFFCVLILVSVVGYLRNVYLSMFTLRQYVNLFPYNLVLESVQYLSRTGSGIQHNEEFVFITFQIYVAFDKG